MLINYDLLHAFVEAAAAPNFAAAARRRHVTPSAVSQSLKTLEGQLGFALFERVGRRARLTEAGQRLAAALRDSFASLDEALLEAAEISHVVRGEVRIGGPAPFCRLWLRPRLVELLRAHPALLPEVSFQVPSLLARRVAEGELDFAILADATETPGLEARPIYTEEFVAVASRAYLKAAGVHFEALYRYIVFDDDLAMHAAWWRASFGRRAAPPPNIVCRVANLDEMLALAEAGVGVAVLPNYFVEESLAQKRVVRVGPATSNGRRARNVLSLAWRRGAVETARFHAVRALLLA